MQRAAITVRRHSRFFGMMLWTPFTVLMGKTMAPFGGPDARAASMERWKRNWARGAARLVNLDLRVQGDAPALDDVRPRLIVANHRTPLDVISLFSIFGGFFVANHKTRTAPIVGFAAHQIGTIFVDRDDRRSGAHAIRAMKRLLAERRSVIVFPEGTTHAGDEVRPFKPGALLAVRGVDVEIVPVGIAYAPGHEFSGGSLGAHARGFLERAETPVRVTIGAPLQVRAADKPGAELADELRDRVAALVLASRAAMPASLPGTAAPSTSAPSTSAPSTSAPSPAPAPALPHEDEVET